MTYRMVVLTVGLLGAGVMAPALVKSGERGDYTMMAVLLSVVMLISGVVAITGIKRLGAYMPEQVAATAHPGFREGIRTSLADRNFRMLVLSYLFTGTVTHLFMAALPYYSAYVFDRVGLTAVFMAAFLVPALVASPLWLRANKRGLTKQKGLLTSQTMFVLGSLALAAGSILGLAATVAIVLMMGVAFAGLQLFAFSMVPDVARAANADGSTGASYTGVWTATEATGTAIGPYVYSMVLAIGGFAASSGGQTATQSSSAMTALIAGFTIVPAVLMIVAMAFQRRYRLNP
jgi:Na+/melibiose symporter-like transporter